MKLTHVLVPILTFALGWIAVSAVRSDRDDGDLAAQLVEAQAEIKKLKLSRDQKRPEPEKLTSLPSAVVTSSEKPEPTQPETEEVEPLTEDNAEAALANLLNSEEARTLIKGLTSGIAKDGQQWIGQEVSKYTEKLNLTDEQVARLTEKLTKNLEVQAAAFTAQIDDESMSMEKIFEQQTGDTEQDVAVAKILKEELTEEQYAKFERDQLEEKTERVQRDADREMERLESDLELSDSQKDQVFGILVQTSSDYDGSMAIEGAEAEVNIADEVTREDAIREVLDDKQREDYEKSLEKRKNERRGWGGFGGFGGGR